MSPSVPQPLGVPLGQSGVISPNAYQELLTRLEAVEKRLNQVLEPKLQIQIGINNIAFPIGFGFTEIILPKAWTKRHLLFLPSLHPQAENGCWLTNWGPYNSTGAESLVSAFVEINNPKAQNIVLYWISVGE